MASKRPPSEALAAWLARQRWFAGKTQRIASVELADTVSLGDAFVGTAMIRFDGGETDRYAIPLRARAEVADALDDPAFCRRLLALVARGDRAAGERGAIEAGRTSAFPVSVPEECAVRRLGGEQSNTSVAFDDALVLKHFRRLREGVNPELEVTRFLTERTRFRHAPRLAGYLDYRDPEGARATLAVVQELVPDARDGWQWVLGELQALYIEIRRTGGVPTPEKIRRLAAPSLRALHRLGERTGELHGALASDESDSAFKPEPITGTDVAAWMEAVRRQLDEAARALGRRALPHVPLSAVALDGLRGRHKIRHHGDFHLGQTLYQASGDDFFIIDFEGEPLRTVAERRQKHAAVRDVAGLRRSLNYAAVSAGADGIEAWASAWEAEARREFVAGYRAATVGAIFLPETEEAFEQAVAVFEVEKAAYEIVYEANNRPEWIEIPIRGLLTAAGALGRVGAAGAA
jgi:predicted trehalose synthase